MGLKDFAVELAMHCAHRELLNAQDSIYAQLRLVFNDLLKTDWE